MYRNLLTLVLVLAIAGMASAANTWWGTIDDNWETDGNWETGVAPVLGEETWVRFQYTTHPTANAYPVIGAGDVALGGELQWGVQDAASPAPEYGVALGIIDGGTLDATGLFMGEWNANGIGQIDLISGTANIGQVGVGSAVSFIGGGGSGTVNMYGGTWRTRELAVCAAGQGLMNVYAGNVILDDTLGADAGWPAWFRIEAGGILNLHDGDVTIAGDWTDEANPVHGPGVTNLLAAIAGGRFRPYGQADGTVEGSTTYKIVMEYDGFNEVTTFTSVPEPATIALLGLGGLLLRRKR